MNQQEMLDVQKKGSQTTFQKMQEYVNQQTEYMNTVITHQGDDMERFADKLTDVMKQVAEFAKYRGVTPIPEVAEPDSQGRDTTAMSALSPNDRALRD